MTAPLLLRAKVHRTIPVGLTQFPDESVDRGRLIAELVLAVILLVTPFVISIRQNVAGITAKMSR